VGKKTYHAVIALIWFIYEVINLEIEEIKLIWESLGATQGLMHHRKGKLHTLAP
jgi:hypothetical protein